MFKNAGVFLTFIALLTAAATCVAAQKGAPASKILGRWDMTVQSAEGGSFPSWLEITQDGDHLTGRFVGQVGSQRPIKSVTYTDGVLKFSLPIQYEQRASDLSFEAKLMRNMLEGTTTDPKGTIVKWSAVRAPSLARKGEPKWGKPIELFNGHDLTGWRMRDPSVKNAWEVEDGVMVNAPHSTDIITERKFTDFKLHVEFKMVEKSNSGVYLRGRHEVQIQDDYGKEPESHRIGGVYGFITPTSNPAKKPGEWQTYDITLVGRNVTVVLNGETIIDNAEIPGITGGALDSREGEPGPLMLQGDHEKIYYRNIVITPAK